MKKLSLSICLASAFCAASAGAQMAPSGGAQGSPSSSPTTSQPSQYPSQGAGQTQTQTSTDQGAATAGKESSEHTLKGCVQSAQGGSYVLETRKGKSIALAGEDVSSHVGHEVALKGNWEGGSKGMASTAAGAAGTAVGAGAETKSAEGKTFNVSNVRMISESCKKGDKSEGTGSSHTRAQPQQ